MTDENEESKRPNSNYSLSYPEKGNGDDGLHFYYNREKRLANAPEAVRNLYNNDKKPGRFNLFGPLVADRPRRILFASIILLCIIIWVFSAMGFFDAAHTLDGNRLEITGTIFEGVTIITIKKTIRTFYTPYTGAVYIAVSVPEQEGEESPVFYHRIDFSLEQNEQYRFSVPFDSPEILMVLQSEKDTLRFSFKPQ